MSIHIKEFYENRLVPFIKRWQWCVPKANDPRSLDMFSDFLLVIRQDFCSYDSFDHMRGRIRHEAFEDLQVALLKEAREAGGMLGVGLINLVIDDLKTREKQDE